jgi:SnoaL-like domain
MSQENVGLVYRLIDAVNRHDLDAAVALADPEIEYSPRIVELEGGGPYRGHDGVRRWWESWLHIAPDFSAEIEEVRDLGGATLSRSCFRAHGIGSGATIEQTLWQYAEWRQKKCLRWRTFATEAEALEAAGLSE